jgi:hypothetical protein
VLHQRRLPRRRPVLPRPPPRAVDGALNPLPR